MSRKNSSKRWTHIWKRFHRFVLGHFPERESIVATDGTGFSGRKRSWRETPYAQRAKEDWVKVHAAVEIDSFLILNIELTESNVHESKKFEDVWDDFPDNITPVRSLADSAYTSDECIRIANEHGAKAFHDVKSNAIHVRFPETAYQKLVNFATHWPNRFRDLKSKRAHVETAFGMVGERFGHRIRCRTKEGRKNEVRSKYVAHNIMLYSASCFMMQY